MITPNPDLSYNDKVVGQLFSMQIGETFNLKEKVSPERRKTFINCVKEFMDYDNGKHRKFYVEFSNDYSLLTKKQYSEVVFEPTEKQPTVSPDDSALFSKIKTWYYKQKSLKGELRLDSITTIKDLNTFFEGHLRFVENNFGNKNYQSYWDRLVATFNQLTAQ